jgi:hypothetical protein
MADEPLSEIDLLLERRQFRRVTSDREVVDLRVTSVGDVATTTGLANLGQAVLNRLLTRQGELEELGHPEYGSRLYELNGEINNRRARILAEMYIRECLAQEPRIAEVLSVTSSPPTRGVDREVLELSIKIRPVGLAQLLTLGFTLNLGG